MNQGHRAHPLLAFAEHLDAQLIVRLLRLQVQQAGDDLQIILHAVMHFLEQNFFFFQRSTNFSLGNLLPVKS